ncbi:predicted protein [Nematostella vectensis]|uniref:LicD/FKTN/FKRP nucleotidyltransferase domain-containing protein n=1 Tax=Nematostella vectensis TaxID=45351 RepID=A7RTA4_NEMVE|nr:predicted protein [Nematostella vectensis]|eukprot:XP_001637496.1 predicted protein [Nematostella vectensis]
MAKFGNMFLSDSLHKVDRGVKEGVPEFPDYAHFGNDHGILRIVQEARIEWTTCIANGQQCKEKPYFPPVELPRLGMPICCMVVLDRMLQDITNALNTIGIRYRVIYGTLLGGIRSKAIIPWTHDVDLGLDKDICSNRTFFSKLQDHFGGMYYLGHYFMDMPRMVPHIPAYIEVNNSSLFKEGYCRMDLDQGFYSEEIKKSIESLTPLSLHWRDRGYLDFNPAPDIWWNGSALVEINRKKYITIRDIDYELKNWYGYDYMKPALHGETWNGLSDVGA